jgi:hypothetical protein
MCRWMGNNQLGMVLSFGLGQKTERVACDVWRAIVALQTIEMACKEDPVEDFGHGISWFCYAYHFEEFQDALLDPFLCCKILYVHVSCPYT